MTFVVRNYNQIKSKKINYPSVVGSGKTIELQGNTNWKVCLMFVTF